MRLSRSSEFLLPTILRARAYRSVESTQPYFPLLSSYLVWHWPFKFYLKLLSSHSSSSVGSRNLSALSSLPRASRAFRLATQGQHQTFTLRNPACRAVRQHIDSYSYHPTARRERLNAQLDLRTDWISNQEIRVTEIERTTKVPLCLRLNISDRYETSL